MVFVADAASIGSHPRWQKSLLKLFDKLSNATGNQFLLATHSPTFISPSSIQYVSRVYSEDQKSRILRLNETKLPNAKHRFNVVNSQNNERLFFSDRVVLVEGISDRIFLERCIEKLEPKYGKSTETVEIIEVGGKGFFPTYVQLLGTCGVKCQLVADLDYIEQIGSSELKGLFLTNSKEIRTALGDAASKDADALVSTIETAMTSGDWMPARGVWE